MWKKIGGWFRKFFAKKKTQEPIPISGKDWYQLWLEGKDEAGKYKIVR